jgi:hypothetical protein
MHEILIRFNGTEYNENNLSIYIPMYETKYHKIEWFNSFKKCAWNFSEIVFLTSE